MAHLQWDDSLSVNYPKIDQQHKDLFALVNQLVDAFEQRVEDVPIKKLVEKLTNYFFTHFRTEERVLEEFEYPDIDQHRHQHLKFTRKVMNYRRNIEAGEMSILPEMIDFLVSWVVNHTSSVDMKYSSFFTEKGLTS